MKSALLLTLLGMNGLAFALFTTPAKRELGELQRQAEDLEESHTRRLIEVEQWKELQELVRLTASRLEPTPTQSKVQTLGSPGCSSRCGARTYYPAGINGHTPRQRGSGRFSGIPNRYGNEGRFRKHIPVPVSPVTTGRSTEAVENATDRRSCFGFTSHCDVVDALAGIVTSIPCD